MQENLRRFLRYRRKIRRLLISRFSLSFNKKRQGGRRFLTYWMDLFRCQGGGWHDEILFKRLSVDGGEKDRRGSSVRCSFR